MGRACSLYLKQLKSLREYFRMKSSTATLCPLPCPCPCSTMKGAALRGHAECVARIHQSGPVSSAELMDTLSDACTVGSLECIRYLCSCGAQFENYSRFWLIYRGRLPCVQFLYEHGEPWAHNVMAEAAMSGRVEVMQYIFEHMPISDQPLAFWNPEIMYHAARDIECMQYADSKGCEWHKATIERAAQGHLACLQYCYNHGASWSEGATSAAASMASDIKAYADCLRFLVERGCCFSTTDYYVRKNRVIVAEAMARRNAARIIQIAWRAKKQARRHKAVSVIQNYYLSWAYRPGTGALYKRSMQSFAVLQETCGAPKS